MKLTTRVIHSKELKEENLVHQVTFFEGKDVDTFVESAYPSTMNFHLVQLDEIENVLLTDKNNDVFIVRGNVPLRRKEKEALLRWKSLHNKTTLLFVSDDITYYQSFLRNNNMFNHYIYELSTNHLYEHTTNK